MLFSSPVAEALGTPDQDVHTVAGDEANCQHTERAHLVERKRGENWLVKNIAGVGWGFAGADIIQNSKNFLANSFTAATATLSNIISSSILIKYIEQLKWGIVVGGGDPEFCPWVASEVSPRTSALQSTSGKPVIVQPLHSTKGVN